MRIHTVFSISLSMIVVGCAIRPLPKNVTRDTTFSIVEKIRCEARDALIEVIKGELRKTEERNPIDQRTNKLLLSRIEGGETSPEFFCTLPGSEIGDKARENFILFAKNTITYGFEFDVTENKIKKGGLDFSLPFTRGSFGLKLGAGADKKRQNLRVFEISETFSSLVTGLGANGEAPLDCQKFRTPRINARKHWVYPITGNIGLKELVRTYVDLEHTKVLTESLKDTLTFTTVIDASADATVTLNGIPSKKFRISNANLMYSAKRTDKHEVAITLVRGATEEKPIKIVQAEGEEAIISKVHEIIKMDEKSKLGKDIGLALATITKKKTSPDKPPRKADTCSSLDAISQARPGISRLYPLLKNRTTNLLYVSPVDESASIRKGVAESRRLDALDTSRSLRDLIGK